MRNHAAFQMNTKLFDHSYGPHPTLCLDVTYGSPPPKSRHSLTRISLDVVVDDLLPAVGEVDVVDALGVLALALLLVPEVHAVLRVHLVTEAVVRRAEIGMDS